MNEVYIVAKYGFDWDQIVGVCSTAEWTDLLREGTDRDSSLFEVDEQLKEAKSGERFYFVYINPDGKLSECSQRSPISEESYVMDESWTRVLTWAKSWEEAIGKAYVFRSNTLAIQ